MKRDVTIIFLLVFIYSCSDNGLVDIDTEEEGLIGNVKSLTSITVSDSNTIEHKKEYFDKIGLLTMTEFFYQDSVFKTERINRDEEYRVLSKKTTLRNGATQTQNMLYGYNGLKKISQELNGEQNTVWTYDNDEDGRKVKETVMLNDEIKRVVRYQYVNDSIMRAAIYNKRGDKESMIEYLVTENKLETTFQTYFSKNYTSTSRIVITLDSLGNPIKETHFREGKESDVFTYWYDYDEKKNWVIKFSYSNGELVQTTERQIEYYK